jgi:hypothetical protein
MSLTKEQLKDALVYDSNTGVFIWKEKIGSRNRKIGGYKAGCIANFKSKKSYELISLYKVRYFSHRLAWLYVYGSFPSFEIDHIDGNGLNNSISNLRECTRNGNNQNIRKAQVNNRLGLLGVFLHKETGKYRSRIMVNRKIIELGLFKTPEEAHCNYINAKRKYHSTCSI